MEKYVDYFLSADGITNIRYVVYRDPSLEPVAVLQISHGMCEYIDRYDEFAAFMVCRGFIVCGNDHLGHGGSVGDDCDYGYFSENNGYNYLIDDTKKLHDLMKEKYPYVPYAHLGHSMGSFVLRAYINKYPSIDSAVIMGTSGAKLPFSVAIGLAKLIKSVKGDRHRSPLLYKITLGGYNKKFRFKSCTGNEWLSTDNEVVKKYSCDRLCTFRFTDSAYIDLFRLLKSISSEQWYDSFPEGLPVLFISGNDDPVGEFGKGVIAVSKRLEQRGKNPVHLLLYDGARHEILNEKRKNEVMQDIYLYLKSTLLLDNAK